MVAPHRTLSNSVLLRTGVYAILCFSSGRWPPLQCSCQTPHKRSSCVGCWLESPGRRVPGRSGSGVTERWPDSPPQIRVLSFPISNFLLGMFYALKSEFEAVRMRRTKTIINRRDSAVGSRLGRRPPLLSPAELAAGGCSPAPAGFLSGCPLGGISRLPLGLLAGFALGGSCAFIGIFRGSLAPNRLNIPQRCRRTGAWLPLSS